ncbi:PEP-CTERM sorting domain-containing protein [Pseudoduganella danionis]|uniref:PEP-CTERM sorting domain-containing protein n=1 Tax=Pseudoduganella danionis TaxID=1890295 RepID=UPI0035AE00E1
MNKLSALIAASLATVSFSAAAGPVFSAANLNASQTFRDALGPTTMTLAYDGSSYWSASGGGSSGVRYANYDAAGNIVATYASGLDFRSVFTSGSTVLARAFNSDTIYQQSAPGVFSSLLTLTGGALDSQAAVVKDGANYISLQYGQVLQWDTSGAYLGSVALSGFGTQSGEDYYPQGRGVAVVGNYWLTYNSGKLSAWDHAGNRVDETALVGAGTGFDSNFSLSYANNKVFVVDSAGQTWRGYEVTAAVPEPETYAMLLAGLAMLGVAARRRNQA